MLEQQFPNHFDKNGEPILQSESDKLHVKKEETEKTIEGSDDSKNKKDGIDWDSAYE